MTRIMMGTRLESLGFRAFSAVVWGESFGAGTESRCCGFEASFDVIRYEKYVAPPA